MRTAVTLYGLSLLIGDAVSLNHGLFVTNGNNETDVEDASSGRIDFHSAEDLFQFFAPLPPRPTLPTKKPTNEPTTTPSNTPTTQPIVTPTFPPIPAGRWPSPVVAPTVKPVEVTAKPVPSGRWESAKPTEKPTSSTQSPVRSVAPVPSNGNTPPTYEQTPDHHGHPVPSPTISIPVVPVPTHPVSVPTYPVPTPTYPIVVPRNPVSEPSEKKPGTETRISSYTADWGSDIKQCEYVIPNVFLVCNEGGVIGITEATNALCTRVANDRVQCTQREVGSDSSLVFTCSGTSKEHLMATATVGPNLATACSRGGNAVKYLTLSRDCGSFSDTNPSCNGGFQWKQDETEYCASPVMCNKQICDDVEIESISMTNKNEDESCSIVDPDQDLSSHSFDVSSLSSITSVEWRISGQGRGCLWKSTPLSIECQDGGELEFLEEYSFCSINQDGDKGECQSFAPYSAEREESTELFVKCSGSKEEQLFLKVKTEPMNVDVECDQDGTIIQSIMLSRGCGEYGTDSFTLSNHPSFCYNEDAVFTVDENKAYCYVGDTCLFSNGCHNIELMSLTADTRSGTLGLCTKVF